MTAADFNFVKLLEPVRPADFFEQYWERKPLLLQRGEPGFYRPILTADDFDDIISGRGLRYPAIRLAKGGGFYPPEAYTRDIRYGDEVFAGVPDVERIFAEYCAGATVTLPALHLAWPPLGALCAQMESQLDHSVHTNAYLTAPQTAGFTPHYDTHEVFILQLSGTKHWRVYPPPIALPHRTQPCQSGFVPATPPLMEFELAAGDLLYLPRGYVHTAATAVDSSTHVTIGVTVYTAVELVGDLLPNAVRVPKLRKALPIGFASRPEARAQLKALFMDLVGELRPGMDPEARLEAFTHRVLSARPRTTARFHANASVIGPDTRLRVVSLGHPPVLHEDGMTILQLAGRRLRLQAEVKPLLEAMYAAPSFTPADLPGALSLNARLSLVRYLHGLGVVQAVS